MKIIIELDEKETHPTVTMDSRSKSFDGGSFDALESDIQIGTISPTEEILVDAGAAGETVELDADADNIKSNSE